MQVNQLALIAVLAGAGFFSAFLFDCYRVLRSFYLPPRWITFILDVSYCVVITAAVTIALFRGNWIELRLYALVAIVVGWGGYYFTLSPLFIKMGRKMGLKVIGFAKRARLFIGRRVSAMRNFFARQDK